MYNTPNQLQEYDGNGQRLEAPGYPDEIQIRCLPLAARTVVGWVVVAEYKLKPSMVIIFRGRPVLFSISKFLNIR